MRPTLICFMFIAALSAITAQAGPSPAERRNALIKQAAKGPAALPALTAALQDENLVVRRTAVRLLGGLGAPACPTLVGALDNSDALVRRAALAALTDPPTAETLPYLQKAVKDPEPFVRLAAVHVLVQIKPQTQQVRDLLEAARQDENQAVREVAAAALWPFFKEVISVRERKDWDHEIKVAQTIPLSKEGWRFKTDPMAEGHLQKWFAPEFDDSSWLPIQTEAAWEEQGQTYDGVAWYRTSFDLPEKPQALAVELAFGGVDEVAWVWVNGEYVGQHDLGIEGWDKPFTLDVTKELKWGQKNHLTVRVYDSKYAGGIWKPVRIEVLQ